jgi:hypothetical protein
MVERSITGEDLVDELEKVFTAVGGPLCNWITDQSSFLRRCNSFAMKWSVRRIFRWGRRGITGILNRLPIGWGRSA